jgi:hypothetical protein
MTSCSGATRRAAVCACLEWQAVQSQQTIRSGGEPAGADRSAWNMLYQCQIFAQAVNMGLPGISL